MRLGIHLSLWQRTWDEDVRPHIDRAAQLGYEGIEISLFTLRHLDPLRVRHSVEQAALVLTCSTGLGPDTDISSSDAMVRRAGLQTLHHDITLTAEAGSHLLCGMLYGSWGVTLPGQDRQAAWQRSVGAVRDAGAYAREHGVTLALEVLNRYETSLLNTAAQARRFVEAVALPNVGILLDTYHMNIEERDPAGAIRTAGLMLAHFHCSDNDRSAPGEGHLRWPEIVATLRMIGYRGWLTVECGATAGTAVAETYNIWRDLGSDPDTVARRALQFLRRTLAETSEQV